MFDSKLRKMIAILGLLGSLLIVANIYFWYKYSIGSWYHDAEKDIPNSGCLQFTRQAFPGLKGTLYSPDGRVITILEDAFLVVNSMDSEFDDYKENIKAQGGHAWLLLNPFTFTIEYKYEITRNAGVNIAPQYIEKKGIKFRWQNTRCG